MQASWAWKTNSFSSTRPRFPAKRRSSSLWLGGGSGGRASRPGRCFFESHSTSPGCNKMKLSWRRFVYSLQNLYQTIGDGWLEVSCLSSSSHSVSLSSSYIIILSSSHSRLLPLSRMSMLFPPQPFFAFIFSPLYANPLLFLLCVPFFLLPASSSSTSSSIIILFLHLLFYYNPLPPSSLLVSSSSCFSSSSVYWSSSSTFPYPSLYPAPVWSFSFSLFFLCLLLLLPPPLFLLLPSHLSWNCLFLFIYLFLSFLFLLFLSFSFLFSDIVVL